MNLENASNTRLKQILKEMKISKTAAAQMCDVTYNRFSRALQKQSGVDAEIIQRFLRANPQISGEWIISGRGPMMLSSEQSIEPVKQYIQDNLVLVDKTRLEEYAQKSAHPKWVARLPLASSNLDGRSHREFEVPDEGLDQGENFDIKKGDILRTRKIEDLSIVKKGFLNDRILAVVTNNIVLIGKAKVKENMIHLRVTNPIFSNKSVDLANIKEAWLTEQIITNRTS